ncbi:PREDICTED: uncharacterized protein LOC106745535 [Dinoponera quadriceps]|uniref:DNA-directed DNA polymerase n=1 Tax=Dinoponera quadriceps TaxID=609295 RepID=A0A6P3XFP5_DINQU|nr:PREDICTED: uncharacterized protein LOC106745535 [Dinoponera quadriceps]
MRDHCHLTSRYRGPAHSRCNLNYRNSHIIPAFFHNLSSYDAHFIIERIANSFEGSVDLLPINKERYLSFTKNIKCARVKWRQRVKLRFVDSFRFLSTSLDKLASFLDEDKLRAIRSTFSHLTASDFALLTRNGVFPLEYIDSAAQLTETELPSRDAFYSSLSNEIVSEADYEHAETVWRRFDVRNFGEYSDLYLKTDVMLLADIFENFRDVCTDSYGLDPAHYYTLPGYTWDAMLEHTNVRLELLTDIDMVLFIERGIRGGLSQCSNRYARANNRYMSDRSSSSSEDASYESYLMYYDVNNLYVWAMSEPLPYGDFHWLDDTDILRLDVTSVSPISAIGYILEVDIAYPHELHDAHADLPFCPTRECPPAERSRSNNKKLLTTLRDKSRYVIHYRCLQQCIAHGLFLS